MIYLTDQFVQAMGLKPFLHQRKDPYLIDMPLASGVRLLNVPMRAYDWVVVYQHALFAREADGLAWCRHDVFLGLTPSD